MPQWLGENPVVTVIILALIVLLCALLLKNLLKSRKSSCSCGCASCPMKNGCKKSTQPKNTEKTVTTR